MESQITLLVWPCLLLNKNNAELVTWSFLMIQSASFTSATLEDFTKAYLFVLVSALAKKNAKAIKFLRILKNTSP